nr:hypothetical protein [Tanacetum cinerariifolium]
MTNDQANYYSGITSITFTGKNAYELKGKFLDDLHKNDFSGTNGKDVVEHMAYFLEIVDPINLPNINQDKLRVVVFPISLVGDAWRCFDGIIGSITSRIDLTDKFFRKYYPPSHTSRINNPIIKWDLTNPKFKNWLASNLGGQRAEKEALRNKAIIEGIIEDDDESSYERRKQWNVYDDTNHDHEHEMDHEVDERHEICSNETHVLPVCNIRRFE